MAYDEGLAARVEEILDQLQPPQLVAKKMFGGVGYLVQGNMACGVHKESLVVRVGKEQHGMAIQQPHTRPFDITGRPMQGWVLVDPDGVQAAAELRTWVQQGIDFALTLPSK